MKVRFSDICTIKSSKRIYEHEYVKEGIPFIRGQEISDGSLKNENVVFECYISQQRYNELKNKYGVPVKGDILITAVGTIGNLYYVDKNCNFYFKDGNVILFTEFSKKVNSKYLYYYMQSNLFKKQLEYSMIGAVQKALTMIMLNKIEIELPSIQIQNKIIKILEKLDSKIELNNKINTELESMAKTLYDYWFLQFEFPNKEGKPYKSSGGKMVWNEELKREIPEGWEAIAIGDITNCHDSKRIPLTSNEREEKKGDIPYYGATGVMGYVDEAIFNGDYVLVAEDGSVKDENGNPIIQRIANDSWVNNHAHVLEPIKNYSCRLLMLILKDIPVVKIKTGSIQMKINQENLNKFKVVDIPENLKKRTNGILNCIDKKILEIQKENQELTSLRDFLLPLLMNGQVGFKE